LDWGKNGPGIGVAQAFYFTGRIPARQENTYTTLVFDLTDYTVAYFGRYPVEPNKKPDYRALCNLAMLQWRHSQFPQTRSYFTRSIAYNSLFLFSISRQGPPPLVVMRFT